MRKKVILFFVLLCAFALVGCTLSTTESESTSGSSASTSESSGSGTSESSGQTEPGHTHAWAGIEYSWNGLECTAETVCTDSTCQQSLTETATAIYVKDTDATCYHNEMGHFEVEFESEVLGTYVMPANSAEKDDTMLEHTYGDRTYVWDGDSCTASVDCEVEECPFVLEETVIATIVTDTEGDCENNAIGHYQADFESDLFETQATETNSMEIPDSIKHQTETVYDASRRQNVTACSKCSEEFSAENMYETYEEGDKLFDGANYAIGNIPLSALEGKAIHFEFKFTSETGKFQFSLSGNDWLHITNIITIEKTANGLISIDSDGNKSCGRIVEVGYGWYAWELNASKFPSAEAQDATTIDYINPRNTIEGNLLIDWNSFDIVDAYLLRDVPYMNGDLFDRTNFQPILMSDLQGKAVHLEFKFGSETGSFGFSIMQSDPSWQTVSSSGTVITKTASGITASEGRIVEVEGGWYAWEMNASDFIGKSSAEVKQIDFVYQRANAKGSRMVDGTLYIDWESLSVVNAYKVDASIKLEAGAPARAIYFKDSAQIAISDLLGKAIQVSFKLDGNADGAQFAFSLHASAWNNMTGTVVISKSGDSVTANMGIVVAGEDGWYNWQLCHALFMGDGSNKPNATNVSFIYTGTITQPVSIDGVGVKVVDAYDKTSYATQFAKGDAISTIGAKRVIKQSDWNNAWSGFSVYVEFKFESSSDGELFRFAVVSTPNWKNYSATIVISKSGDKVTANRGTVIELEDGWYAWTVEAEDFEGDGASYAEDIGLIIAAGQTVSADKVWILPYIKAIVL